MSESTSDRILDLTAPIALAPLPPGDVVDGAPLSGVRPLSRIGPTEFGIWEMTPGVARDVEEDEVFVVLSGSARIDFEDGQHLDLTAGSAVRLSAGERTTWTVHETLRKIYLA